MNSFNESEPKLIRLRTIDSMTEFIEEEFQHCCNNILVVLSARSPAGIRGLYDNILIKYIADSLSAGLPQVSDAQ